MSSKPVRRGPLKLAVKLKRIREGLELSQSEMVKRLQAEELINRTHIANYERGEREPTLRILLAYARTANVYMEAIVDDELDLPADLPSKKKSTGILSNA